jgi:oxygen-independent coproporphyrinogen III oxidase
MRSDAPGRRQPAGTPGLYIHVPFCKTKCPYCGFYSITDLSLVPRWMGALAKEMERYTEEFTAFDSVFLGGGTPSCLEPCHLEALLGSLFTRFPISGDAEVTCEINPDDVDRETMPLLKSLGVNRVSIGVQSFSDEELAFLKRRHSALQARKAVEYSRTAGFTNISLDLIFGFPGHEVTAWQRTLETALFLEPSHLSCYQMTFEEHTPFEGLHRDGVLKPIDEDEERRLFLFTSRFLETHRFQHYEVSNFARFKRFRCRHNMKYWNHTPYLGLGPGAHSFLNGRRWWNVRSVERYCALLEEGGAPVDGSETLSPEQVQLETLFLGLRTKAGIPLDSAGAGPGFSQSLENLEREGFIRIRDNTIIPTRKGFLFADRLPFLLS